MTAETKVEVVALQLIDADGKPAFMPYTNKKQADDMVAHYQDDTQLRPCDQEIFTIRELVPASALDALRGEVAAAQQRVAECETVLATVLGGMLSGAVKCKPLMTKRDGDYVVGSLQELIEQTLTKESP